MLTWASEIPSSEGKQRSCDATSLKVDIVTQKKTKGRSFIKNV